ncbi:unnamed protein product [Calypogeia fissa]
MREIVRDFRLRFRLAIAESSPVALAPPPPLPMPPPQYRRPVRCGDFSGRGSSFLVQLLQASSVEISVTGRGRSVTQTESVFVPP